MVYRPRGCVGCGVTGVSTAPPEKLALAVSCHHTMWVGELAWRPDRERAQAGQEAGSGRRRLQEHGDSIPPLLGGHGMMRLGLDRVTAGHGGRPATGRPLTAVSAAPGPGDGGQAVRGTMSRGPGLPPHPRRPPLLPLPPLGRAHLGLVHPIWTLMTKQPMEDPQGILCPQATCGLRGDCLGSTQRDI